MTNDINILILPGNSPRHAEWANDLKSHLLPRFDRVEAQHYKHWQTGEKWADVDYELSVAKATTVDLEPYIIIGKSIGTVIAVKGAATKQISPVKLILLGIPINGGANADEFNDWLGTIDIPVVIIQNTDDPLGSFEQVSNAFKDSNQNITFIESPGDTHDYLDFKMIAGFI